jgi:type IV pilus assembly protein PilE
MRRMKNSGFTLLEVMITVAIVAILTAVAVPAYSEYVIRGRIPEATAELATRRVQAEQYFQDNRTYADVGTFTNPACVVNDSQQHFNFSCTAAATANTYTIQAVGKASMIGFTYRINQNGTKTTGSVKTGWVNPAISCGWVTKKDGTC